MSELEWKEVEPEQEDWAYKGAIEIVKGDGVDERISDYDKQREGIYSLRYH